MPKIYLSDTSSPLWIETIFKYWNLVFICSSICHTFLCFKYRFIASEVHLRREIENVICKTLKSISNKLNSRFFKKCGQMRVTKILKSLHTLIVIIQRIQNGMWTCCDLYFAIVAGSLLQRLSIHRKIMDFICKSLPRWTHNAQYQTKDLEFIIAVEFVRVFPNAKYEIQSSRQRLTSANVKFSDSFWQI